MTQLIEKSRLWLLNWIDSAAEGAMRLQEAMTAIRSVELHEQDGGGFRLAGGAGGDIALWGEASLAPAAEALLRDARVTLTLRPERFLFRTLDLPAKASEFVDGVIRAQIDRLTPWTPAQAAFGHGQPQPAGDRIAVTLAATSLALLEPLLKKARAGQVHSLVVLTRPPDADAGQPPIKAFEAEIRGRRLRDSARRAMIGVGAAALAFAGLSVAVGGVAGAWLESELEQASSQTRAWRQSQRAGALDPAMTLHRRKFETPLAVLALEALSRILPDDTHLKQLQIVGDKIEISGVTRDAPKLIGLIEQVPTFTQATFSAPTTRAANEPGETFHIEARLKPKYALDHRP